MSIQSFLPPVIIACGSYMLIRLRFFTFLSPHRVLGRCRRTLSSKKARSNLALALAGTLGVGNIVGVAVGISVGGSGALFWILISSVFSSVLKYSEATLSSYCGNCGYGFMPVLEHFFPRRGRTLGRLYAMCCLLLSFVLGAALQSSAVFGVSGLEEQHALLVWCAMSLSAMLIVARGGEIIRRFTLRVVPLATLAYVLLCLFVILRNIADVPTVLARVISSAFTVDGGAGGAVGAITSKAVGEGFSRGLLSNEAGAGTSSLATSDGVEHPTDAGILGLLEVVFDTVLLCTLTGLAVLVCIPDPTVYISGAQLVRESIGAELGAFSSVLVACLIFVFAFSTVVCWYYYGIRCLSYLTKRFVGIYTAAFLGCVAFLPVVGESVLFCVSDVLLLILTLLTVTCIIKGSDKIRTLSELSGLLPFTRR